MKTSLWFLTLFLLLTGSSLGQTTEPAPLLKVSGMSFAITVADMRASTDWYTAKLGLHVAKRIPKEDGVAVTLLEGGGLMVELIARDGAKSLSQVAPGLKDSSELQGLFKVGIFVDDYDDVLKTLKARGVEIAYGPYPAREDQKANAIIRDNSGNLIQFMQR